MDKSKTDGLYLLGLGILVFLLFGVISQCSARDANEDFRAVVYGAGCLLHHCDPYNETELFRYYQQEFPDSVSAHLRSHTLTLYINLPATILVVTPLALLPFGVASALWCVLTACSLTLAAFLIWDLGSQYAPTLSGALIALSLSSAAIVLGNGNPAGVVVAFALISVWCFVKGRYVVLGVCCLAISLALKPHDAGLVWLCLLLMRGAVGKRALQTLTATAVLSLAAVLWVSTVAPHWLPELRSNFAQTAAPGYNNNPGPSGVTSRDRAIEMIVSLQSAVSLFRDDPPFYNKVTYVICGVLLLVWLAATLRSRWSPSLTLIALAAVIPITLLVTYHRAYDARLLMLVVPASAMLYAESRTVGKVALLLTALALISTGELPYAVLKAISEAPNRSSRVFESVSTDVLDHSAPILLLLLAGFFISIYLCRSRISVPVPESDQSETSQSLLT